MLDKEFVPYQESLELKELNFNESCFREFHFKKLVNNSTGSEITNYELIELYGEEDVVAAPTFSQAFRWFREKYGLKHDIDDDNVGTKFYYRIKSYTNKFDNYDDIIKPMREEKDWAKIEFKTYEEAELACLRKLIEIVKK